MFKTAIASLAITAMSAAVGGQVIAADLCTNYGPQTPRDIAMKAGSNPSTFMFAQPASQMNLCNLHFHTNAEHKGPNFSIFAGPGKHGGYQCNGSDRLTEAQLQAPAEPVCNGLKPGATIEVHWVYSSCDVKPGKSLAACSSEQCGNPQLRVESQVFLVVNDKSALDFADFTYANTVRNGRHQAKSLPSGTGAPVVFLGSTTGPKYTSAACSPMQVTWSVRPQCAVIDIASLGAWCKGNVFKEDHAHGVRQLVTAPELLATIK